MDIATVKLMLTTIFMTVMAHAPKRIDPATESALRDTLNVMDIATVNPM